MAITRGIKILISIPEMCSAWPSCYLLIFASDLAEPMTNDLREFLDSVRNDEAFDPKTFDVPLSRAAGIALLENVYGLCTPGAGPPMSVPGRLI